LKISRDKETVSNR